MSWSDAYLLDIANLLVPDRETGSAARQTTITDPATEATISASSILLFLRLSAIALLDLEFAEASHLLSTFGFDALPIEKWQDLSLFPLSTNSGGQQLAAIYGRLHNQLSQNISTRVPLAAAFKLIGLYEAMLDIELTLKDAGWCVKKINHARKQRGCYYTPEQLTRATAAAALDRLVSHKKAIAKRNLTISDFLSWKIVDPAMGAGAFLVCALDYLQALIKAQYDQNIEDAAVQVWAIAENCLYGVDLDSLATQAARLTLWLYCAKTSGLQKSARGFLESHLKSGDSLISCWSDRLGPDSNPADFDSWCARFFWPLEAKQAWSCAKQNVEAHETIVEECKRRHQFFHWELEFPEIFTRSAPGFDAVISNPPWEIAKPNAKEFFSAIDSTYKAIGKTETALAQEKIYCQDLALQAQWMRVNQAYKARASFFKNSAPSPAPLQSPTHDPTHDPTPRFARHVLYSAQGVSDFNAYKLFLELGFSLLETEGCLAMLTPAGIYTDKGATQLRRLLMDNCDIYQLRSFVNRDRAFAIHPSFNFCIVALQKGMPKDALSVSFSNTNGATLEQTEMPSISYSKKDVQIFSPIWRTLVEIEHHNDLNILRKIYAGGIPLGARDGQSSWQILFSREFDLTNDSASFVRRSEAEASGYVCDEFGNWLKGRWQVQPPGGNGCEPGLITSADGQESIRVEDIFDVMLPLYEGRMLGQFDCNQKQHVSGSGRTAVWQSTAEPVSGKQTVAFTERACVKLAPQYLLPLTQAQNSCDLNNLKVGYLAVGSATNARTMIAAALNAVPCGNSVPVFLGKADPSYALGLVACLNSFVFDYVLRLRMSGNNINYYLLEECPLPSAAQVLALEPLIRASAILSLSHRRFAPQRLALAATLSESLPTSSPMNHEEQVRNRCLIDAVVAHLFHLTYDEYAWILRQCHGNLKSISNSDHDDLILPSASRPLKGFWRVDKNRPPEKRLSVRCLQAYADLLDQGLPEFVKRMSRTAPVSQAHTNHTLEGRSEITLELEHWKILSGNLRMILDNPVHSLS